MAGTGKLLTRIQLINWHFFENERIALAGAALISGDNTAGKSTILDAIQMVLTTNTRHFNTAANERGKRTLLGYVRGKTGNVGDMYLRKNTVPANVALEFYEEKNERYFVCGVHLLSPDEESPVVKKWYVEECRLEDLSFVIEGHAALDKEFTHRGRRIKYIESDKAAKEQFRHRLGNLEEKFFEIIPKSLAFKPMDNVKEFINRFVLGEEHIEIDQLKGNIESLKELEYTLDRNSRQIEALDRILKLFDDAENKDKEIEVNDILLSLADADALRTRIAAAESELRVKEQALASNREALLDLTVELRGLDEKLLELNLSVKSNSAAALLEEARRRGAELETELARGQEAERKLKAQLKEIERYLKLLAELGERPLDRADLELLGGAYTADEKGAAMEKLAAFESSRKKELEAERLKLYLKQQALKDAIDKLQEKRRQLERQELRYPPNTEKLRAVIEAEFKKRGIDSEVYVLAELLEISDTKWTDAVEGYLNTQKFYLIVDPAYYDIALETYHAHMREIHSAGIVNTKRIPLEYDEDAAALSSVVRSENRYAAAYAHYVMGRVVRCDDVHELEAHERAVTADCMLYQNYVLRHMDPRSYENPYIGKNAYRVQLTNVKKELDEKARERSGLKEELAPYENVHEAGERINLALCREYMNAPTANQRLREQLARARADEAAAAKDPTLIELQAKLEETEKDKQEREEAQRGLEKSSGRLEGQMDSLARELEEQRLLLKDGEDGLQRKQDEDGALYHAAEEKYRQNRKNKAPEVIKNNFSPRRAQLMNEKEELQKDLHQLQSRYNTDFTEDMRIGLSAKSEYRELAGRLRTVDKVKYEEKLRKAMEDCERIFRSDFLSKMKEYIESARKEFRDLNRALENIYYGEDSYRFKIMPDKKKEGLYRMITSENNVEGEYNLWTSMFEEEYKDEIRELFDKLTAHDDSGQKVVDEYTDYRSYLDYDIEIHKRNGKMQSFSDIYGEKSGSETQVPYYVAIAASFYQLYRFGSSVRIMLLDEAFDKMDDERIHSMMEFFNSLKLQTILATPPGKIEVIGEHVDTILTAIRVGSASIVEEYEL